MCLGLLTDLLKDVVITPDEIASSVLTGILNEVVKPKKHSAHNVSDKTKTEWEKRHPWLLIDVKRGIMKCRTCSNMQSRLKLVTVWANEGSPNFQYSGITRHITSAEHKNAIIACEQEKQLQTINKEVSTEIDDCVQVDDVDKKLFNTVYYAAKMEIPSNTINALLDLQTKNGLDIKYTNLSWDTVSEIQTSIEHVLHEDLVNDIKSSPVFALMLDESTDLTVDKRLSICVRYVKGGEPVTNMLVNVHLEDGTAHTIVNCVAQEFERYGIDLAYCTSLATDGAAVMLGKHKGVGKQLVSKYSPFCIQTHCMAHRLNLACTDSIKKNDFMLKFREKFNSLYLFISGSSNRTLTLKKIKVLLNEPEISIKEPYSIRWLGLKNAVSAVYDSFGSVLATLSKFAAEKNTVAKGLLKYFGSYKVALAVAFILDVHNELAVLSCELQKKNLLFSEIKPVMDATVSKLSSMQTTDGKCLTSMKSGIQITDDGVVYSGEKLSFHKNMDSEFDSVRADYIKRLKKNISDRFRKEDSGLSPCSLIFLHRRNVIKLLSLYLHFMGMRSQ